MDWTRFSEEIGRNSLKFPLPDEEEILPSLILELSNLAAFSQLSHLLPRDCVYMSVLMIQDMMIMVGM